MRTAVVIVSLYGCPRRLYRSPGFLSVQASRSLPQSASLRGTTNPSRRLSEWTGAWYVFSTRPSSLPKKSAAAGDYRRLNTSRVVRIADLINAKSYEQIFATNIPPEIPGTTALGTSRAVLSALKTKGEAELTLFDIPPALPGSAAKIAADPKSHIRACSIIRSCTSCGASKARLSDFFDSC